MKKRRGLFLLEREGPKRWASWGIHHPIGPLRRAFRLLLGGAHRLAAFQDRSEDHCEAPAVLADSMPKSGTHLLEQIVDALPRRRNYGRFLESMTASNVFRERSQESTRRYLESLVSGETVRAHLHYDSIFEQEIARRGIVHYFICRDLRDVVVSETHYLRSQSWWHRLHPSFRSCASFDDALLLAIEGLDPSNRHLDYPDVGSRFRRFLPWLESPDVHVVRYEELMSADRTEILEGIVRFYAQRSNQAFAIPEVTARVERAIDPGRSHTFRRGGCGEWQEVFNSRHREAFARVAGDMQSMLDQVEVSAEKPAARSSVSTLGEH